MSEGVGMRGESLVKSPCKASMCQDGLPFPIH